MLNPLESRLAETWYGGNSRNDSEVKSEREARLTLEDRCTVVAQKSWDCCQDSSDKALCTKLGLPSENRVRALARTFDADLRICMMMITTTHTLPGITEQDYPVYPGGALPAQGCVHF